MRAMRLVIVLVFLSAAGCASDRPGAESLTWRASTPPPASPAREETGPGETVHVPDAVLRELIGFVNRPQFLIADRIEVDASRIPFQAAMVPVADPGYVETVELSAAKINAVGILIRSLNPVPMVDRDFPRLRVGDGTDLVAVKEITVRTYNEVDGARPLFIAVRGLGHAIYRDESSGRELRRDSVTLTAEAVPGPGGLSLRTSIK
ncbi:MAG: hypothetical protein MUE73_03300 [Planctomycetes bacterium]|jgi:hypothetical protein|nr:hypothetical protein [Planctomycetota bacterium]